MANTETDQQKLAVREQAEARFVASLNRIGADASVIAAAKKRRE